LELILLLTSAYFFEFVPNVKDFFEDPKSLFFVDFGIVLVNVNFLAGPLTLGVSSF
tara:strand:- start:858 stop:1025 length:168 start_codon:yes stop_codon:yes gene_type:complete